ncbi:ribose-phosphate pyrophosphokinase [Alteromonas macleodii]|uniref:Ribose-phosphate pyrophosphokinase n=1 Tax=Alteromonas macleodii TaxID=28108 RepID=A0A6T9XYD1_ALTMA|nr:ribose-phosphate pyrophosphokinase [Alteromonas macleodii]CAB9493431.1 conserved exported protein of unknown function [Alteromonas macleodii]
MTTHRLKLVLIFTSVLTLVACSQEEANKDINMVDKEKQMDTKVESMPKELVAEPVTQAEAIEENVKGEVSMKGSIIYKDLEGGFYAFIAENGDRYTLHGLDETYQKNGLVVEVKGTPKPDMMTFTQFGTVLQVSSVKVLDTSKVIDNLQTK